MYLKPKMIRTGLIIALLTNIVTSQEFQIEDIPIESFDQASRQENDMDLELLPRHHRSFDSIDPKEYFFRSMRSFEEDTDDIKTFGPYANIPRPITFTTIYSNSKSNQEGHADRKKRSAKEETISETSTETTKEVNELVYSLGKPLEVANLDTEPTTPLPEEKIEKREEDNVLINDFIRFRRSANEKSRNNSNSDSPYKQKLNLDRSDDEINRETRGTTRKQWIRQAYPVKRPDEMAFSDNIPMSSENFRVPRVHFRGPPEEESPLKTQFKPYAREARGFGGISPRDQFIEPDYYRPRYARPYYDMERSGYPVRFERDPPVYRPRYENFPASNGYDLGVPKKPQKRIIYYATLPEISRPTGNLRDRYPFDRYEDRYFQDPYSFRKGGYQKSSRYEKGKTPFPVKVSTDVNVREVKKNPERRIYSEVDRDRFPYSGSSTPYQSAEG